MSRSPDHVLREAMMQATVEHPDHYTQGGLEVIDILRSKLTPDQFEGFCCGNALKYLFRYQHKGNATEDLQKALWYIQRLIELHGEADG